MEIKDDNGRKFECDADIARVLEEYFKGIFSTSSPSSIEEVASLVSGRVTATHRAILDAPFSRDEVE